MRYSIFDPAGNITALVETPVDMDRRQTAAAEIMAAHPEVEQAGFVRFANRGAELIDAELQMAGGEFCGNASLCTAALYDMRHARIPVGGSLQVRLRVSGAAGLVDVSLTKTGTDQYRGTILMPPALSVTETVFRFEGKEGALPVVHMQGISHIIIRPDSAFGFLRADQKAAEQAVKEWCAALQADGLGLMFLDGNGEEQDLTPLVYIPGSGTIFWENSCGSGSSAVGRYLAAKNNRSVSVTLHEPGGIHIVKSDHETGATALTGNIALISQFDL